jgi:RNA polymerase sigma-70 factor (ECF subfamily)
VVRRAQQGDRKAFESIYARTSGWVYGLCLRLSGDADRARELTQETYLRVWKGLGSYRPGTRFDAWLRTVAMNTALGERRYRRRRWWEVRLPEADHWEPAAPAAEPRQALDLESAIADLPAGARKVFVLFDVEGLRHEEIGRLLGMSAGTSKAQLHRARRLLREALRS